ncbi:MAG: globin family protein [Synechococcales cyanobacterium]
MALNVEQLTQSFDQVRDRGSQFSATFYDTLLSDYPQLQPLFQNTHMMNQGKKLFESLVLVVDNLHNGDVLTEALSGLGTRHVRYGVLPQHYPMVGSALLKTFGTLLGSQWTPDVQQAWIEAYQAVSQIMLTGADYDSQDLQLSPS